MKLSRLPLRPLLAAGAILAIGTGAFSRLTRRVPPLDAPVDQPASFDRPLNLEQPAPDDGQHREAPRVPRFSIAGLLLSLFLVAIGVVCLLSASAPWAGAAFSALLAFLTVALVGISCRRGPRRAYWAGAAICGTSYLVLSLGPWFDAAVRPSLITTRALHLAYPLVVPEARRQGSLRPFPLAPPIREKGINMDNISQGPLDVLVGEPGKESLLVEGVEVGAADGEGALLHGVVLMANPGQFAKLERARREKANLVLSRRSTGFWSSPPVSNRDFERVGHAVCGIVCALIGGALGRYFYATNDTGTDA